jgi:hypothetical protein
VNLQKVRDHCDRLRGLIDLGPGLNLEASRKALGTVRALRAAAEWDFPRQILDDLKERLTLWFSDRVFRGDNAALRNALFEHLAELCTSWKAREN